MSDLPDWTKIPADERDRLLAGLCAKGLTASQIAAHFLNCSRSAAIGRISRLKLSLKRPHGTNRHTTTSEPKAATKPKEKKQPARAAEVVSWRGLNKSRAEQRPASPGLAEHLIAGEAHRPQTADIVPLPRKLKLVELTERTCKWPIGDPQAETFAFCGNDAATGPYCKYHARVAYIPATVRQRASQRSAERIR